MERNFTNTTTGSKKGTTRHFAYKLFSLMVLLLFTYNISQANALLDIEVTSTDVTCSGSNDGTATVTPFNAWDPITYTWSNGETSPTITGLAPGLYEVTVIDGDGSIDIGSTYVGESSGLELFLSASYETCDGSNDASASVNVSGGSGVLSYLWSTGETFVVASNLSAGTYTVTVTDDNGCSAEGSIVVELSPEGVWLMTSSTDAECGLDNGTAHVSVMAGTAPFSILWSNGQMGEDISGLSPGTYTVSVTDANGCSNTETVVIESDADLNLDISGTDATCNASNGSATVTVVAGSAPFTYAWNNGANTATIDGLSAGTYVVTVTDATGCSNVISVDIDEDSGIDVDVNSTDADCSQNDGTATASVNNGTAPYNYAWSNGANTATITGLAPGTYTVTATDANGCEDSETVTVEGDAPEGGMISTNDNLQICAGDGVDDLVNVSLSGNTGANSRWVLTNPAGDIIGFATGSPFNFDGAGAGNCVIWHLSYEDGLMGLSIGSNVSQLQGCYSFSNSITVIRTDPDGGAITTNDNTSICVGDGNDDFIDVARTGASGAAQAWLITDQLGNILGLPASPPFNFEGAGLGTCLIWSISYEPGLTGLMMNANVSGLNGCYELSNSIEVVRNATPTITLTPTNVTCAGNNDGSISSSVTGGSGTYTYNWSNGATTANLNNIGAGTYSVTVTDTNGCSATANTLVTESSPLSINTSGSNETCMGNNDGTASATVSGGTAPYSYAWNNGGNTATISGLAPGTYGVTVTDDNGCTIVSDDIVISSDGITSCSAMVTSSYNEGVDISTFGGNDGTASASGADGSLPYTYAWSNGQTGANASGLSAGTYTVTVTDAGGCSCVSDVTLIDPSKIGNFVWTDENRDGVQDPGELGIGGVTINLTGTSASGAAVMRTVNTNPDGSYQFDGLPAGNYKVTFAEPSGYAVSPLNAGGDDSLDSDMNPDTGMTENFDLGIAECNNTIDAGLYQCVNIGDFVFYDGNHDGIQQPWEAGYANAIVNLKTLGPDGIYCTADDVFLDGTTTGNNGRYLFECVEPGTYYIEFGVNTSEYAYSEWNQGGDDELDSDANPDNGKTLPFTVVDGMADDLSFDAGVFLICDDFNTGGQIGYNQDICAGEYPDPLVNLTLPGGGYGATEYIWLTSTTGGPINSGSWTEIPNTDSPTYAPPQLYQTTYFIRCARRENCDVYVAESNAVIIVVNTCAGALIQNLDATIEANSRVKIAWNTSPEDQLFMYHVERSFDGVNFEEIGQVNGFGDLQTMNYYSFMDDAPRMGRNVYRIVREHLSSNQMIASDNVEVMFSKDSNRLFVYPNPATTTLFVESLQTMNGNASLELYDATGKLLDIVEIDYTSGEANFNFENYAAGLYFIKVRYADEDDTDVIKVVKE